jgi:TonB family protein
MRLLVLAALLFFASCAEDTQTPADTADSTATATPGTDSQQQVDTFSVRRPPQLSAAEKTEYDSMMAAAAVEMSEESTTLADAADELTLSPDVAPQFPGGETGMNQWLKRNLIYPGSAWQNNIRGVVMVRFSIEKDGRVENASVTGKLSPDCDAAALSAVERMPAWSPARKAGKPVRTVVSIPVNFDAQQ